MTFLALLELFNYSLVLVFGLYLSIFIAGGWANKRQKVLSILLCPVFLAAQGLCWLALGGPAAERLYPFIVHLPLILIVVLLLKKTVSTAVVSVCTAYLCCQLPHWAELMVGTLLGSQLAGAVAYTVVIVPLFFLLYRYFVRPANSIMTGSLQSMILFGSLPVAYYAFDYATTVYSDILYEGGRAMVETLPTVMILFYLLLLTAYHVQQEKRAQAELQRSMLEAELKQSGAEMENLRQAERQAAIYQHDIRHHLTMIQELLAVGKTRQAEEYIQRVQSNVGALGEERFCENELIHLLCASFAGKAKQMGIQLKVEARLHQQLPISDIELCSLVSNGLENALNAVSAIEEKQDRWVRFYCDVKRNKLLVEIKNPYTGKVEMRDGLPISDKPGHGYGCSGIKAIVQRYRGLCSFEAEDGVFTFRAVLAWDRAPEQNS